jgi:hypothetical protein
VAAYLDLNGVQQCDCSADIVLNRMSRQRKWLFATRRALVQHVGKVTTGLGKFHWAVTYVP